MAWSVVEAKAKLPELPKRTSKEQQIIENKAEPVAVVISAGEYEALMAKLGKRS